MKAYPHIQGHIIDKIDTHILRQEHILDVGAGDGDLIICLKAHQYQNVYGCDIEPNPSVGIKYADLNHELPYKTKSMDCITAIEVLEHLDNVGVFFEECYRVLKPGGILFITVPSVLFGVSRLRFLIAGHLNAYNTPDRSDRMCHVHVVTPQLMRLYCERYGFKLDFYEVSGNSRISKLLYPFINLLTVNGEHNSRRLLTKISLLFKLTKK